MGKVLLVINIGKGLLFILVFLFFSNLWALDPNSSTNRYLVDQWDVSKGLPSNTVFTISQTSDGFLWVGTSKGLVKFSGLRFQQIFLDPEKPENVHAVYSLFIEKNDTIWVGSDFGLSRLNGDGLRSFFQKDGLSENVIKFLFKDMHNSLWLATSRNYLNCYKDGKISVFDDSKGFICKRISSVFEDSRGHLWIGAYNDGLFKYQNGIFLKQYNQNLEQSISVYSIYEKREGGILIGSNKGLIQISETATTKISTKQGLPSNSIYSILEDDEGNIWLGTRNGLSWLKAGKMDKVIIENGFIGDAITTIFQDKEKSIWVGTEGSGLKRLRNSSLRTYSTEINLPHGRLSIYKTRKGDILVGSNRGIIYKFEKGTFTEFFKVSEDQIEEAGVTALTEDKYGSLWVGTAQQGVFQFTPKKVYQYTKKNGLNSNEIQSLLCDSRNYIWIGTYDGGLSRFSGGRFESYTNNNGLLTNSIFNILEDSKQNIWIGTSNGLQFIEKGIIHQQPIKIFLEGSLITAIYERKDVLWCGTYFNGLKRLQKGELNSFSKDDGLISDYIYQMVEDNSGNFWMTSYDGLFKVSRSQLNELLKGTTSKIDSLLFGISDGMRSEECSYSTNNSIIRVNDQELWFATKKGIAVINPNNIRINKYPPPVIIEKIELDSQEVKKHQESNIFKGVKNATFHFTAVTFISPQNVKFKYKLEGFEEEWETLGILEERKITYYNLSAGQYRFRVIACNSNGIWNREGDSFPFVIKPLVYHTLGFKILGILALLLLSFISYWIINKYLFAKRSKKKYKDSYLDKEKAQEYIKKLTSLLEVEKIHKEENLSLQRLAQNMGIPPHLLSQIINEYLDMNFWDLINSYRIKEAQVLLLDSDNNNLSILDIAYEVGFNSGSAFNRAFKKFTKVTPSQYKKTIE
jgi:ligand-binding sensor domain-containing protein/AraC-like DNA-binding protein